MLKAAHGLEPFIVEQILTKFFVATYMGGIVNPCEVCEVGT